MEDFKKQGLIVAAPRLSQNSDQLFICAEMSGMQKSGPLSSPKRARPRSHPSPNVPEDRGRHSCNELWHSLGGVQLV